MILLWNKYQLTGSRVYKTIFKRITSGQCKVWGIYIFNLKVKWILFIRLETYVYWNLLILEHVQNHHKQKSTECQWCYCISHARSSLGRLQFSKVQRPPPAMDPDDLWVCKLHTSKIILQGISFLETCKSLLKLNLILPQSRTIKLVLLGSQPTNIR